MEPNSQTLQTNNSSKREEEDDPLKPFCEREYEEVEDGYIDDRGFYTTPNGSFWDEDRNYFNHLGFDKHGGTYDKYGLYIPGPDYDEKLQKYKDEMDLLIVPENENQNKTSALEQIQRLKAQEKTDEETIKKFELPIEDSEDDDEFDKSDISYNENDIKEAYDSVMENEKKESEKVPNVSTSKKNEETKVTIDQSNENINNLEESNAIKQN